VRVELEIHHQAMPLPMELIAQDYHLLLLVVAMEVRKTQIMAMVVLVVAVGRLVEQLKAVVLQLRVKAMRVVLVLLMAVVEAAVRAQ
jgi:hypothetical protein